MEKVIVPSKEDVICPHTVSTEENGIKICMDCGLEINKVVSYEKEWRYYGSSDTKHTSDPNRCQSRKIEDKSIFKDVENMGFSDNIVNMANEMYIKNTGGKTFRGNSRKSRIFACIFNSYKLTGNPQSCDMLCQSFNISRRDMLKGLKHVNLITPKQDNVKSKYITPIEIIKEIMDRFYATVEQKEDVIKIYLQVQGKSNLLSRSRPQSIASGIIYYYIKKHKKDIAIKDFLKKVSLSELTINKIMKEIKTILEK